MSNSDPASYPRPPTAPDKVGMVIDEVSSISNSKSLHSKSVFDDRAIDAWRSDFIGWVVAVAVVETVVFISVLLFVVH